MNRKTAYLFLALLLPSSVFVFLKLTGKNKFDIPVYYEKGIDSLSSICGRDYSKPYFLNDSVTTKINWIEKECSLIALGSINDLELKRLDDIFSAKEYSIYRINDVGKNGIQLAEQFYQQWRSCVFIAKEKVTIVMIDKQKRIRGYYMIGSREEMDRLIVEMKILLKKY